MVENNSRNHFIKPHRGDRSVILKLLSKGHPYGIWVLVGIFLIEN